MSDRLATQLLPAFRWHDPRAHPLEDTWLLTIFTIALAIGVPWFVSGLDVDFATVAIGLLALGALHVGFAVLAAWPAGNPARRTPALSALHALGITMVAFIWHHAGGLHNPLFLLVFALPVIGSIFLSCWQPYLMATVAAISVALAASREAPELRWYAPGVNTFAEWLSNLLGANSGGASVPFAALYAPSGYFVVLLEVFVVMLVACAVAAEYLGTIFDRLHAQVTVARAEAARGQELWSALVEQLPLPVVLLDADSYEIVCASAHARAKFFGVEPIAGRDFFQLLRFSYPEAIQSLINGAGGVEHLTMLRLGERLLASEVRVQHVGQHGRRLALVTLEDTTEAFCLTAALDVAEQAAIVADAQGRILLFNKPARALFSQIEPGADVSALVPQSEAGARWWDPGLSGRRKLHLTVTRRVYQVTSSAVALPGEDSRLYVVAFLPAPQLAAADQTATGWTKLMQRS